MSLSSDVSIFIHVYICCYHFQKFAPAGLIPSQLTSRPGWNFTYNSISDRAMNELKESQLTSCNHPLSVIGPPSYGGSSEITVVCLFVRPSVRPSVHLSVCLPACLAACLAACLPACLPAWLPACLGVCLPAFLLACLPAYLSACLSVRPSIRPSVRPSVHPSVYLYVCLSISWAFFSEWLITFFLIFSRMIDNWNI